jgi:hypothetical protein
MTIAMNRVLDDAKNPVHKKIIAAAFGRRGPKYTDKIKAALELANKGRYMVNAHPYSPEKLDGSTVVETISIQTSLADGHGSGQPIESIPVEHGRTAIMIAFSYTFHGEQFVAVMFHVYTNHH